MDDLISRQAAIDATWFEPSYTDPLNVLTEVRDRLKVLPSAQPERKTGRWIDDSNEEEYFTNCSECGYQLDVRADHGYFNYCPNCGSFNGGEVK